MALAINGTTGISGVDGSASAPAIVGSDANTGLSFASDTININTGGTTRATLTSAGRLGVGTTSPARVLHSSAGTDDNCLLATSGAGNAYIGFADSGTTNQTGLSVRMGSSGDSLIFQTGGTNTRMVIDSAGKLLVGMTSQLISSPNNPRLQVFQIMGIMAQTNSNSSTALVFQNPAGRQGFINTNASGITIVGTSDYRVKENINYSIDGINKIKQVKPCSFKFKADTENLTVHGFIAHELQAVLPEAVTGEKDEVVTQAKIDKGEYEQKTLGNEIHQGVDAGKLIPIITKALQEAITKIETLETKVAALEAA